MSSFPMGSPVAAERHRSSGAALVWRYGLLGLTMALLTLLALQLLLGRQQARQQRQQLLQALVGDQRPPQEQPLER